MLRLIYICGGILLAGILPLLVTIAVNPESGAIGPGLLWLASQFIAGAVFVVGLGVLLVRRLIC